MKYTFTIYQIVLLKSIGLPGLLAASPRVVLNLRWRSRRLLAGSVPRASSPRVSSRSSAMSVVLRSLCSSSSRPLAIAARVSCRSMSGPTFPGAFTSSMNPAVEPHHAPASNAPAVYTKNRVQFQVNNPEVRQGRDAGRKGGREAAGPILRAAQSFESQPLTSLISGSSTLRTSARLRSTSTTCRWWRSTVRLRSATAATRALATQSSTFSSTPCDRESRPYASTADSDSSSRTDTDMGTKE